MIINEVKPTSKTIFHEDYQPNTFEGQSIEEKIRRLMSSGEAIEAISPMIYQERKEGVKAQYDIRADKFEVAQAAMESIAKGVRDKRKEKIAKAEAKQTETKPTEAKPTV